jgi:dTDP-4-amino-4,6-dideoxygalactose transaminase
MFGVCLSITEQIADEELSLPMSPMMTLEEVEYIVRLVNEYNK